MADGNGDLEADLRALEGRLGVTLTVHDRTGIFRKAAGVPLLSVRMTAHQHPACRVGRREALCLRDCQQVANERARRTGRPYIHACWKGVAEIVVPIVREDVHVATIFAGAFRKRKPRGRKWKLPPGLPKRYVKLHSKLPVLDRKEAGELGRVLTVFGRGMISRLEELRRPTGEGGGRKAQIRRFLMYQAHRGVRLADLARVLHLSPPRTSHVVKKLFGIPFRKLLLRERLSRARTLLLSREYSVGEAARLAGFENEYYFNSAFKKRYGLPPGRFRRRHRVGG
jgi:AraC-like DNA-binding protein